MSKRVVVTGARGLIGLAASRQLAARGHEILGLHRPGSIVSDEGRLAFARADLRDEAAMRSVLGDFRPDVVVHLAAHTPRRGGSDTEAMANNLVFTANVLNVCPTSRRVPRATRRSACV